MRIFKGIYYTSASELRLEGRVSRRETGGNVVESANQQLSPLSNLPHSSTSSSFTSLPAPSSIPHMLFLLQPANSAWSALWVRLWEQKELDVRVRHLNHSEYSLVCTCVCVCVCERIMASSSWWWELICVCTRNTFSTASFSCPARLPSVQTTCSGSSGCTVVCTLVRLAGEARDDPQCPKEGRARQRQPSRRHPASWSIFKIWEHAAPALAHLEESGTGLNKAPKGVPLQRLGLRVSWIYEWRIHK